ncbi:mRNA-capping enzyme small subunit [Turkeypox virus]|uniref:mRNA-capping enzyme small subunit n=1 Tax=Turkeypox virus TaxID=336486 RepID=A0A0M3ZJI3_9POXV|nr:mRNA-capping enzyme small subunit [Turkeypox virus]ALA62403.1 mRNA-capping enzyme small subunit [Turkeypox virus]
MEDNIKQQKNCDVTHIIRNGISKKLAFYESLPPMNLVFGKNHLPSLEYGANYFLQLSKINDINRLSTDMLALYTHDLNKESDIPKLYEPYNIKTIKSYGKYIQADAVVVDFSAQNMLFKKDHPFYKSNNYLKENNLYICDYKMITFEIYRPVFELLSEKICIIKVPTLFGRTIVNVLRVYCSLFKQVTICKLPSDSWLKDSAIIICQQPYSPNINKFTSYVKKVTGSQSWTDTNNRHFILIHDSIEPEFIELFLSFSYKIYEALYYVHSLLYNSMTSDAQSLDNDYQKKLIKLLRN